MKKNIVFDMGNVLIHWDPKGMVCRLGLNMEDGALLVKELFNSPYWVMLDRGTVTERQVVDAVAPNLPEHIRPALEELVLGWWRRHLNPVDGMAELCKELKENGYKLYLLSNASVKHPLYWHRIPASRYFDATLISANVKLLKPQHEIYELAYARFDIDPAESIFIDDAPANVEGSIYAGMDAVLFRGDIPRLRRELRAAGINVSL